MKNHIGKLFGLTTAVAALSSSAQIVTMTALSSFGASGWDAPGSITDLTAGSTERGLAYADGDLFLVSRNGGNSVQVLNPTTGSDIGSLNVTGISGGAFAVNAAAAGGNGVLYVGNLTTSATTAFTVYEYSNPLNFSAAPTVAYSGNPLGGGTRLGDDLAATGSGASTELAAGYGSGSSGYELINPSAASATAISFTGSPPNAGDFRLGITFTDSSHVLGTQGSSLYRYSSFSGSTGTLLASPAIPDPAGATADRLLAYTVLDGVPLLAVQSTGDSHVSLYNATDPTAPVWIASLNNTTGTLAANGNATGELAWGGVTINGDGSVSEDLYAMSTGQGIQAFDITVTPEPATFSLLAIGLGAVVCRKKFSR